MYNLKIIRSGDRIEIFKVSHYVIREGGIDEDEVPDDKPKGISPGESGKQSDKDRHRSLTDARNNIIRLIKSNPDMETFITLTFAKEQDYIESKKSLKDLFDRLRRDYDNLKYLWVLEYGDINKRLHYHLLCNIPVGIELSDSRNKKSEDHKQLERDFSRKYWRHGFVDIRQLEKEGNSNIALYVSTYIVKSLQDVNLEGYRIYGYSKKTLSKPLVIKCYSRDNISDILKNFPEYDIVYINSYGIGYTDWQRDHKGIVTYFDLKLKKEYKEDSR